MAAVRPAVAPLRGCATESGASGYSTARPPEPSVLFQLRHLEDQLPESMKRAFGKQNMSADELEKIKKHELIKDFQRHYLDTGSSQVMAAVAQNQILKLAEHLKNNKKDMKAKRNLYLQVAARNKHLKYMRRKERANYDMVIERLSIRKTVAFDPSVRSHKFPSTSKLKQKSALSMGSFKGKKKRSSRAAPYGQEKGLGKSRTKMMRHAVRQRRLEAARAKVIAEEKLELSLQLRREKAAQSEVQRVEAAATAAAEAAAKVSAKAADQEAELDRHAPVKKD